MVLRGTLSEVQADQATSLENFNNHQQIAPHSLDMLNHLTVTLVILQRVELKKS